MNHLARLDMSSSASKSWNGKAHLMSFYSGYFNTISLSLLVSEMMDFWVMRMDVNGSR